MATALIRGLVDGKVVSPSQVIASGPRIARNETLARLGIHTSIDNRRAAAADIVVLAVKPQILEAAVAPVRDVISPRATVISIAAGISTHAIENLLAPGTRVIRAMPNTPALVRAGATAIVLGRHATADDADLATTLFQAVGLCITVDESQMDAVTGLSGSGPAYIFLILEALADAGVKVGLSRRDAQRLAAQTVMGSAKLLIETDGHPGQLKDMVTSPGGTAIAGLHTLEQGGLRTTLMNAVESATERARVLGKRT